MQTSEERMGLLEGSRVNLEASIALHKQYESDLVEKARRIKTQTGRERDLAILMLGIVNSEDTRRVYEGSLKGVRDQIKEYSQEIGQTHFDLGKLDIDAIAELCGTAGLE